MPLDTSIPLQVQMPQFAEPVDPATQQYNALRMQALQQEMMRNQLIMQNTMEDRRLAAANRAQAAAQAAAERRRQQEFMQTIRGGYDPGKTAVMGPGTVQGSTAPSYDPNRVLNALYAKGDPAMLKSFSELQEQFGKQREIEAKVPGVQAESREKETKAKVAELDAAVSRYIPAVRGVSTPDDAMRLTDALYEDPTLGPLLSRVAPREQARAQAAQEFTADPVAFMRRHLLTGKELYDATTAAQKTAVPQPATLPPGAVSVDMNPQSPTYGQVIAKGGPTEQQRKSEQQTKQLKGSINAAITSLEEMSKEGGLLDKATASGAGAAIDYGASVLGVATPGAIATGELQVLQDPILKMIPRFEGPQSDKDTLTYQQAAGQLANPNIPAAVRKAAAKTLIKLFKERQGQFAMPDLPEAETGTPSEFEGFVIKEK